ncbi:MAG TPA: hypothetical protein VFB06_04990 [Streptosporangiaceae bacterium]|nr:hypothetical protein [Streptosporangiaceae bacterium]
MRSVLLAAAAGLTALLAAGCSGTPQASNARTHAASPAPSAGQAIELAAAHAAVANSVTATIAMQGTGATAVRMSGSLSEVLRPDFGAELNFPSVSAAGQSLPGGMSEIVTGKAAYVKLSVLDSLTGGKSWLEVPFSELDKAIGVNFEQLIQQAENNSPLVQMQLLAGATGVRVVGTGTIDGVHVTEYAGSYTMAAAMKRLPATLRSRVGQQAAKAGITSVSFNVWLDSQQQVRKIVTVDHGALGEMTVTMLVTSINQPVSIRLPSAADVATIPRSALPAGS